MRPFDHAWRLLKYNPFMPEERTEYPSQHVGMGDPNAVDSYFHRMSRPETFENRQFNVMNIDDEDTRGRVRDTYQELEPANFSTGDEMTRRQHRSENAAQESDPDGFDHRPKTQSGMRINPTEKYPALTYDDMDSRLMYPYPNDEHAGRSEFASTHKIKTE